jgi:hypothetical protein
MENNDVTLVEINEVDLGYDPITYELRLKFSGQINLNNFYMSKIINPTQIDEDTALHISKELINQIRIMHSLTN